MTRPVWTPADITRVMNKQESGFQSLSDLLGLIAQSVQADAIQLGIDLGTGYRRDYFIKQAAGAELLSDASHPPFVITRETRVQRDPSPSGLVASPEWMDQYTLTIGTAGRRKLALGHMAPLVASVHLHQRPCTKSQSPRWPHGNLPGPFRQGRNFRCRSRILLVADIA